MFGRISSLVSLLLFAFCFYGVASAEEAKVTGTGSVGVFNRYVFRGYELSRKSIVVQPAATLNYSGFSMGLWGNIDSKQNPTQSFFPAVNEKRFNETDLTLSYTHTIDKLSLTGGWTYYGTDYAPETEELFVTAAIDTIAKPTFSVYRDINNYGGWYMNLGVSHSINITKEITFDLGASAGYMLGSDEYWRTYNSATASYDGPKYKGLHDGMVKAGFTVPAGKFTFQPAMQYWFPLSAKAGKKVDGTPYNFNGNLDRTLVGGLTVSLNF